MIIQKIERRNCQIVDEGTMGFHDYVERYDMSFDDFVSYINSKYIRDDIEILSISYPDIRTAVIVYKDVLKCVSDWELFYDTVLLDLCGFPKDTDKSLHLFSQSEFLFYVKNSTAKLSDKLLLAFQSN